MAEDDALEAPAGANVPAVVFQDELLKHEHYDDDDDPSLAFFELANAPVVAYRLLTTDDTDGVLVRVRQNSNAQTHTGGVVWETSYLLLEYLLQGPSSSSLSLGRVVEVGAGCGLLGIALAAAHRATEVTLTEVDLVLPLLRENAKRNQALVESRRDTGRKHHDAVQLRARRLDWTRCERDAGRAGLEPHSVDTILGTDVVFAPELVEPLWRTLRYLSHARTVIYLCVQIRCAVSHGILLNEASSYGFVMRQITNDDDDDDDEKTAATLPPWAMKMECFLFRITRTADTKLKTEKKKGPKAKRRKRSPG